MDTMVQLARDRNLVGAAGMVVLGASLVLGQVQTITQNWREQPQPNSRSSVPVQVRAARDKFFDGLYGPQAPGVYSHGPDAGPVEQEIPTTKNLTVAPMRFAGYAVVLSGSGNSVYTEIRMNVEQVLQDPSGKAHAGQAVTVILGGGSVTRASGEMVRRDLGQDTQCGLRPGDRYTAFLAYHAAGDFFECVKTWGLTNGKAEPTYPTDVLNAKSGTSRYAGMAEPQFLDAVRSALAGR